MKLLRKSENRAVNGKSRQFGIFLCPYCEKGVEKRLDAGGNAKGCGCKQVISHGLSEHELYVKLNGMKSRCYNPNHDYYYNYGGRGITICEDWLADFMNFYNWSVKNGWREGLTIERLDNDKGYSPNNCTFITKSAQGQHTRSTKLSFEKAGQIRDLYKKGGHSHNSLGKMFGVDKKNIFDIIHNNIWIVK